MKLGDVETGPDDKPIEPIPMILSTEVFTFCLLKACAVSVNDKIRNRFVPDDRELNKLLCLHS